MTQRTLALSLRPKRFSQLIGQESVVQAIEKQYASKREPPAWMFVGPTGTGKTTIARILALSLQCTHGQIGAPCDACRAEVSSFSIHEVNASEISGVNEVAQMVQGSNYVPAPPSRRNVYILDEAQRLSTAAQNLLLKYFEDAPLTTVWMICTTEQNKILETLKRRCQVMELRQLKANDVARLVGRAFKWLAANGDWDRKKEGPLVEALWETQVLAPALVLNAVEKYAAGMSAEEAVKNLVSGWDVRAICRSMEKGDWDGIRKETEKATADELRGIRAAVAGYLRGILERQVPGPRAKEIAAAIRSIAQVDSFTDATQGPATVAALYDLSQLFGGPRAEQDED